MEKAWFEDWFDSPYYHILYSNHNDEEARIFIETLIHYLEPAAGSRFLDLACGKGRHSLQMSDLGFEVVGMDLSENSIKHANRFASDTLSFYSHDMRKPFHVNYFDIVFNFFTSFGYFNTRREHLKTLQNIQKSLVPQGRFVLDFFNEALVRANLVPYAEKEIDGITFHLTKSISGGKVSKAIRYEHKGQTHHYEEHVRLFSFQDFEALFADAGLIIEEVFGNYKLQPFDINTSPRLIMVGRKP